MLNTSNALVFERFPFSAGTVVFIVEDCVSCLRILWICGRGAFTQLYRQDQWCIKWHGGRCLSEFLVCLWCPVLRWPHIPQDMITGSCLLFQYLEATNLANFPVFFQVDWSI